MSEKYMWNNDILSKGYAQYLEIRFPTELISSCHLTTACNENGNVLSFFVIEHWHLTLVALTAML